MIKTINIRHASEIQLGQKELLAVGKGPSCAAWERKYLDSHTVIGINHSSSEFKTHIAHFTDYEQFIDQDSYSRFVICPAFMNHEFKTVKDLRRLVCEDEKMNLLFREKRLFSYDIVTPDGFATQLFKKSIQENPFIFKYASGVLVVQLAILWGKKQLYTLGIDGGKQYEQRFHSTKGNGLFLDEQIKLMNEIANGKIDIIKL